MSLLALQRDVATWLRDGSDAAASMVGIDHRPGLDVYLNNYRAQLVAGLETSFPHTLAWVGGDAFWEAAVTHIDRTPPSEWTLDLYGRDFPATLATRFPYHPEFAELAWTEWAIGEAFVAADHEALDAEFLANIDWDNAALAMSPTIRVIEVATNVFDIWLALTEQRPPPLAESLAQRRNLLVWRMDQICQVRMMDEVESVVLTLALGGLSFASLCEATVADHGEQEGVALAGTMLGRWIADRMIAQITC